MIGKSQMVREFVDAVKNCPGFYEGNRMSEILGEIKQLSLSQIEDLVAAYNQNHEVRGSAGFNGIRSKEYGLGLVHHLNRLGSPQYKFSADRKTIEVETS